jgi:hypothetical protein
MAKNGCFSISKNNLNQFKRCENEPKSIKSMVQERLVDIIDFTPPQKLGFATFEMV